MYSLFKNSMTTPSTTTAASSSSADDKIKIPNIDSDYFPCPYSSDTSEYIKLTEDDVREDVKDTKEQDTSKDQQQVNNEETFPGNTDDGVLNDNDTDEARIDDKIYIISINGIPYYYEKTLTQARSQMMDLANYFVGNLNDTQGAGHLLITDNNLRKVKIIAPYNFLMLTYNYVIHEISLEYAIKREGDGEDEKEQE